MDKHVLPLLFVVLVELVGCSSPSENSTNRGKNPVAFVTYSVGDGLASSNVNRVLATSSTVWAATGSPRNPISPGGLSYSTTGVKSGPRMTLQMLLTLSTALPFQLLETQSMHPVSTMAFHTQLTMARLGRNLDCRVLPLMSRLDQRFMSQQTKDCFPDQPGQPIGQTTTTFEMG